MKMIKLLSIFIAVLAALWLIPASQIDLNTPSLPWIVREQAMFLSGVLSIALMSLAVILATRPAWLETPIGGMDRIYGLHKWSGILAGVFALVHWLIEMSDDLIKSFFGRADKTSKEIFPGWVETLRDAGEEVGEIMVFVVLALIVISLIRRFPYKFWRHLHRAMPAVYLLLAFHALVLTPVSYWSQPIGAALALLIAGASIASILSLSGRIGRERRTSGKLVTVSQSAPDITRIECELDKGWPGHKPGQFAFIEFDKLEGHHPFTIASSDNENRRVVFEIKALGDFTNGLGKRLKSGQQVSIEGPYGRFLLKHQKGDEPRQIWIAGGIGITPYLAWLEALNQNPSATPRATLHYSTRNSVTDPFVSRLTTLCHGLPDIILHIHDASKGDKLNATTLLSQEKASTDFWFCGPSQFGEELERELRRVMGLRVNFHREAFELR